MEAIDKIRNLQKELNQSLIERETQVEALLAAVVSGVHVLLLGPPGTAKSMLADQLCKSIDGSQYFQWLLTKFSTPEEVFGPVSLAGLKADQYRRVTTGKLPECHVAFLDEIFKANSAILNALLTLINERKFHNNGIPQSVPLISCVGASNELPQGEELGALYDRFILRFWVDYISDDTKFIDMISGVTNAPTTKLTLQDISDLQSSAEKVPVSAELLGIVRDIGKELSNKGIKASDRRWKTAIKVLRAYALLRGESEVTIDTLDALADMLWDRPEDRKTILAVIAPRSNPLNLKAMEYLDAAKELFDNWSKGGIDDSASLQSHGAIKEILKKLEEDMKNRPDNKTRKLREAKDQIEKFRKTIVGSLGL